MNIARLRYYNMITLVAQNWLITPNWITDPDNYTDGDSKVTGNLEDGYIMESVDPECKVKFYGKINDSDTVIAIYIDKEFYGTGMIGLCGNCNGVNDEYDRIENGDSLDAPLRIVTSDMIKSNPDFPPYPSLIITLCSPSGVKICWPRSDNQPLNKIAYLQNLTLLVVVVLLSTRSALFHPVHQYICK